uniref:Uncharacterized protein n=1 Tax=Panagrolaimus sp. PS1159 TaxID=55785 RepID=A0AC35FFB3_9BILA
MVISVGCDIADGDFKLYNSLTNKRRSFELKPIDQDNVNFIEEFFNEIKIKTDEIIDCFCVFMDETCKNKFRQKFIEYAKIQSNIKNVQIVSIEVLDLCSAIKNLSFSPEIGNLIWIFDCREEKICCDIWMFSKGNYWKLETRCEVEKTFKDIKRSPTIEDLQIVKSKLEQFFTNPYIFVLSDCAVNKDFFKAVFSKYKRMMFSDDYEYDESALNLARSILNENGYLKFKSEMNLGRILQIKIRD